jgi:glycine oxidase
MMANQSSDIVIVGGGVIGLSLAYRLALERASVTVLEKGQIGQEASIAGAGILAPQAEMDQMSPLTELCVASRNLYAGFVQEFVSRTGLDIEFSKSGLLYVALSETERIELEKRYQWQRQFGLLVHQLTRQEALQVESGLSPEVRAALFFPEEAYVDNVRLLEALKIACGLLQVRLVTGCQAISIKSEGPRIKGVNTNLGLWAAEKVIIAAGCWSSMIDSPLPYKVPIKPARGQLIAVKPPALFLKHIVYSANGYLVPRRDGRVFLGSTVEWVGYDKNVTLEGLRHIIFWTLAIFPEMKSFALSSCWAGLRPYCEDGAPVLGSAEIEGLYFATGHFRNGLLLAPITAKLMTDLIITDKLPKLLESFSPTRFKPN